MSKKIFIAVMTIVVSWQIAAQTTMTLKQCVETGIANNFDVQQRQLQAQSDEANWKQSKLNMFPDLNASAGHSFNQGRSIDPFTNSPVTQSFNSSNYSVASGVILFNGLAIQNNIRQNSLTYQAAKMDWQQEKDNLTINIILAYLQVLSNADQLVQANNQASLSSQQVERLDVLNKEGAIRPSDLSDLKGQYAGDQLAIITIQNSLETAKINLCQLMNVPYNNDMVLERIEPASFATHYEGTPDKIYQTALEQLALVKAADLRKQSAAKAIKVARGQLFPTLQFNGSAFTNYSSVAMLNKYVNTLDVTSNDYVLVNGAPSAVIYKRDNFNSSKINYNDQLNNNLYTSVGFNLNVPLFNALRQRNRIKQARINYKITELSANTTKTQLGQAIDQAYINMNTASDRYKTILEQVNAFDESFRAAGIRFQQGVGNSIDYLTAKNNLDRANINLIIAKYDFVLRTKILDYYQGKQLW
ncbi:MAG: TolC family protein [Chitinophagaceae bacterium]